MQTSRNLLGQLNIDFPDIGFDAYRSLVNEIRHEFTLTQAGEPIQGLDEAIVKFYGPRPFQKIWLEWDPWSGFTIRSGMIFSEGLARRIAHYIQSVSSIEQTTGEGRPLDG